MAATSTERVLDSNGDEWLFEFVKDGDGWHHYVTAPGLERRELLRRKQPIPRPSVDSEEPLPLDLQ